MSFKSKYYAIAAGLLSLIFCVYVAINFSNRGHYHGDDPSNDAAWMGGVNFNKYGFWTLRLTPIQRDIDIVPTLPVPQIGSPFYFHYPSGPDLVQGLLFKVGIENRLGHQLFSIILSGLGLYFAWLALNIIFSPLAAFFAWATLALSPGFIFYADSLHGQPYLTCLRWFFFLQILLFRKELLTGQMPNYKKWFLKFFAITLVGSWFTLDNIFPILTLGLIPFFIVPKDQRLKWGLLLICAAPLGELIGFSLYVAKNGLVLDGIRDAISDFLNIFAVRAGDPTNLIASTPYNFSKHVAKYVFGIEWFYTWPIAALAFYGFILQIKKEKDLFWLAALMSTAVGAIFWQVFMRQHGMIHSFTFRHAEVFCALGFGAFVQNANGKKLKYLSYAALIFLVIHTTTIVMKCEKSGFKRTLISSLISKEDRNAWACKQSSRLANSTELEDAKDLVKEWMTSPCDESQHSFGISGLVSEVILYIR